MQTSITVRPATSQDADSVCAILSEAAQWLSESGMPLWRENELDPARIRAEVAADCFAIAEISGAAAGTLKFQLDDPVFWPDVPSGEAAYIHRLAVRRRFAGAGISAALLQWAVNRTRELDRSYLRLDCEAVRPRLRAIYESFGFRHRDDRSITSYFVSRYEYPVAKASKPTP